VPIAPKSLIAEMEEFETGIDIFSFVVKRPTQMAFPEQDRFSRNRFSFLKQIWLLI
jgi:hypothetical protein